jgi:hypothetical protein
VRKELERFGKAVDLGNQIMASQDVIDGLIPAQSLKTIAK